jgi:hypothetical protein
MINASSLAAKVLGVIEGMPEISRPKMVPSLCVLESLVEEVFWSSLDRYEDVPLRARLYVAPTAALAHPAPNIIKLESAVPIPCDRANIRRLSPAHGRHGALVVVADAAHAEIVALYVSARATEPTPPGWLCVECTGTGVVRVANLSRTLLEFVRGTERVVGGMKFDRDVSAVLLSQSLKSDDTDPAFFQALSVSRLYLSIGAAIERDGVGGALWLLPANTSRERSLRALGHPVAMPPSWAEPFRENWTAQEWDRGRQDAIRTALANLARVDGAILANASPAVLAFGVVCNDFRTMVDAQASGQVLRVVEPTDASHPLDGGTKVDPARLGGSRHRSAIDFCANVAPAAAVVASHDGGLTVFASRAPGEVRAMRVSDISSTARPPPREDPSSK